MSGLAVRELNVCPITPPVFTTSQAAKESLCATNFKCEYNELAFADSGTEPHKKDFTDILARKAVSLDTVNFALYRYGRKVADLNNNTYGTYYASFAAQPLYTGYLIDWTLVYNAFTGGKYHVQIESTILGVNYTFKSRCFHLLSYEPDLAHRTVKIETYQTGNILASEFDFTDLVPGGWYSSIRVPGTFGDKTPSLEEDKYFNSAYVNTQNREEIIPEYTLRCDLIPQTVATIISEKDVLANEMLVTDYDLNADEIYRRVSVAPTGFSEVNHFDFGRLRYAITCRNRRQNIIKRNY